MAPEGEGKDFLCKVKMTSNLNLQQELLMKPWLRTNYWLSLGEKDEGKQSSSTEYKRRTIENYLPPSRQWGGEGGGRGSGVGDRGSGAGEFCVTIENWLPINCQCWGITGIKQSLVGAIEWLLSSHNQYPPHPSPLLSKAIINDLCLSGNITKATSELGLCHAWSLHTGVAKQFHFLVRFPFFFFFSSHAMFSFSLTFFQLRGPE